MEKFKEETEIKEYFDYKGQKLRRVAKYIDGRLSKLDWHYYKGRVKDVPFSSHWDWVENKKEIEAYYQSNKS